jgi:hypothetical protein
MWKRFYKIGSWKAPGFLSQKMKAYRVRDMKSKNTRTWERKIECIEIGVKYSEERRRGGEEERRRGGEEERRRGGEEERRRTNKAWPEWWQLFYWWDVRSIATLVSIL